jgi:hypothetical protein
MITGSTAIGWTLRIHDAIVGGMPATVATYPDYQEAVKALVQQHRKLRNGRLHLAVYLAPPNRAKRDIYLFEVIEGFGAGRVDPDKNLFAFAYGSTPGLPLPEGVRLWMIVTNPTEFGQAIEENWKRVGDLRKARSAGKATVIYADTKGKKLWNEIGG